MGGVIYLLFGVNRVRRRARQDRPPSDHLDDAAELLPIGQEPLHMLQRGIGRITGRPVVPGNTVQIYDAGDEAYPPMLQAIEAARRSVGLSSYIFRDDAWGGRFIVGPRRGGAARGCGPSAGGRDRWWVATLAHVPGLHREGVRAARFFHSLLPWRMPFLNLRTHKKILVVDGTVGFTGGMNIGDENVMSTQPKRPVVDTHFRVEGPVVAQLTEAFLKDWAFATGEDVGGEAWYPDIAIGPGSPARVINSGPDEDIEKVEFAVLEAVTCAQASIVLMTPYFLPDERLLTALALAAMRGVAVDVVIPERSNKIVVDWATRANVGPLLASGVRIWRSPLPFRHSKLMAVDGEWCLIGSSNWDIRSFRLNFELCIELYDPQAGGFSCSDDGAMPRPEASRRRTCIAGPFRSGFATRRHGSYCRISDTRLAAGRNRDRGGVVAPGAREQRDAIRLRPQPRPDLKAKHGGQQQAEDEAGADQPDSSSRLANSLPNSSNLLTMTAMAIIGRARIAMYVLKPKVDSAIGTRKMLTEIASRRTRCTPPGTAAQRRREQLAGPDPNQHRDPRPGRQAQRIEADDDTTEFLCANIAMTSAMAAYGSTEM